MNLLEKCTEKAELDVLPSPEELALAFLDDPEICYDAVLYYMRVRSDRWLELGKRYSKHYTPF